MGPIGRPWSHRIGSGEMPEQTVTDTIAWRTTAGTGVPRAARLAGMPAVDGAVGLAARTEDGVEVRIAGEVPEPVEVAVPAGASLAGAAVTLDHRDRLVSHDGPPTPGAQAVARILMES